MVQEFHVLRCFSCQTFQVHQVKKSKKWNCKMCGEKQSLIKVYGRGSGADCRRHVQKLNSMRGELHEAELAAFLWEPEGEEEEFQHESDEALACENELGGAIAESRWTKFLSETAEEAGPEEGAEQEENVSTERRAYRGRRPGRARDSGKCKRKWGFSGEPARPDHGGVGQSAAEGRWTGANHRTQCEAKHNSPFSTWAASKISHDASVARRPPPTTEAPPPSGTVGSEAEVGSSKWSRFLSAQREDEEEDEEEAPRRDYWAGSARGRTGSEIPPGFPSVPSPVFPGCFEEGGRVREEVQEEGVVTNGVFMGNVERSSVRQIDSLKFSPLLQHIQKTAYHRDGPSHFNSGLPVSAAPIRQQNLSISKPRPSLLPLFQTDEDFDETL